MRYQTSGIITFTHSSALICLHQQTLSSNAPSNTRMAYYSCSAFIPPSASPISLHFATTRTHTRRIKCTSRCETRATNDDVQDNIPSTSNHTAPHAHHSLVQFANRATRRLTKFAASFAAIAALSLPAAANARGKYGEGVTLTDQVPNFTLPSREAALQEPGSSNGVFVKLFNIAKKVTPVVGVLALIVWATGRILRRAQEKQLRDFQAQLQSFSSMLDLDTAAVTKSTAQEAAEATGMAKQILEKSTRRYKMRNEEAVDKSVPEDIESKVRLDLFRAGGSGRAGAQKTSAATSDKEKAGRRDGSDIQDVVPENDFERAVAACLSDESASDEAPLKAAIQKIEDARVQCSMSVEESERALNSFVSRVVSVQIDRAAAHLDSDDRESLKNLHELAVTMRASQAIAKESKHGSGLKYVGAHAGEEKTREALYRRYAVFCLSSQERMKDNLQSLADMQALLSVSDAHAETINTEIAKGMFQIAVSAAMADGSLDEASRNALEKLKTSFGDFLEAGAADSIMSEVAVMRAMYSLQQLLQEQGVSEDDVRELRRMCSELGVDIDEMLQNADALGNVLGPEAKEFVESLRELLSESEGKGKNSSVLTTAVTIDPKDKTAQSNGNPTLPVTDEKQ